MKKALFVSLFPLLFLCAGMVSAAEISKEWTVFGPYYRLKHRLPDELFKEIPAELKIGSQTCRGVKASPVNGKLDIAEVMKKKIPVRAFYICIPIHSAKGEELKIGAGADWWMDIYLNGRPVGDTLMDGNVVWPPSGSDHHFTLRLKPGKNLLVIGMIGGAGTQQVLLQTDPKGNAVPSKVQFGKEKIPAVSGIASTWKNGSGKERFLPGDFSVKNGTLTLTPKQKPGEKKRFLVKLHLEPGKQYCLNWSAWTIRGQSPVLTIQEKENGGAVYFARKLTNGRNRTGYFYAENPEPYAVLEMTGPSMAELPQVSLKRRIDRSAAFQDWRHQRFPAPAGLELVSNEVVTPHFDFAPALPGGTLNVFAITAFWLQRNRVELEQRFDIRTDGIFTNGHAAPPPAFWARDKQGGTFLKHEVDGLQRASKADCILIDGIGASALTKPMVQKILQEVKRGAGLVICAFDQPYYPYKDGKRAAAVEKLRQLFAPAFKNRETAGTQFVKISAAGKQEIEFGSFGKGRAVLLLDAENIKGCRRICYEIRTALIGKAICWASNRVPAARLDGLREQDGVLTVRTAGELSGSDELSVQFSDKFCKPFKTEKLKAAAGANALPSETRGFELTSATAVLSRGGKTLDWDLFLMKKSSPGLLKNLQVKQSAPEIKGSVEMSRKRQPGETLEIRLTGPDGALWKTFSQPAKGKIWFTIPAAGIPGVGGYLSVCLKSPEGKMLDEITRQVVLTPGDDPENLNFNLGVWGVPVNNYINWLYYIGMRRDYRLDFMLSGNHTEQPWDVMDLNIRSAPSGAPGQLSFGQKNEIKGGAHAPERVVCLSSDQQKKNLSRQIRVISSKLAGLNAKFYFMDHETNLLGYINKAKPGSDYCFSPSCRASLAELVKSEYGTIDKLNAVWGTSFKQWEEITPIVLADAVKTGNAARWIDHRRNMDKVWADLTSFRIRELRKYDPAVRGYVQNLHSAYTSNDSFSGIDYERLFGCEVGAAAMPESYINAFTLRRNRTANALGGSMWPPSGGAVDEVELSSLRAERVVWQGLLMGLPNCLYYLHNFISHGNMLFNDIFMFYPDMRLSPEGKKLSEGIAKIQRGADRLVFSAKTDDSGIAMLYSRSSEHACTFWQRVNKNCPAAALLNPRVQQFEFFAPAVEESGRAYASTASRLIKDGGLEKAGVKLLILPFAQSISAADAEEIRKFVRNGGTVIADFRPAVTDQHGAFGQTGLLDDVFGIRQDLNWDFRPEKTVVEVKLPGNAARFANATAGNAVQMVTAKAYGTAGAKKIPVFLENSFGKGRAILLNFTTADPAFHRFFGKWLDSRGIPALFSVRTLDRYWITDRGKVRPAAIQADTESETTGDKTATEDAGERETLVYENTSRPKLHRFTSGDAEIIGYYACRRGFAMGNGMMKMEFAVRKPGHVYDLINGKYLGETGKWETVMPLEGVAIYGILPFPARAPELVVLSTGKSNGGTREVKLKISLPREAASIRYPVRLTITDPAGRELTEFARTITVDKSAAETVILLPQDAAAGKWQITGREVFGGKTATVSFTL